MDEKKLLEEMAKLKTLLIEELITKEEFDTMVTILSDTRKERIKALLETMGQEVSPSSTSAATKLKEILHPST
jgi:hypothetical protein